MALLFRAVDGAPVIVGANREELYARGGEPPRLLQGACRAAAGVDPVAGGTWLGVNEHGVLVAVTNRPKSHPPPGPRSRGLLARDLLQCRSASRAAARAAEELGADRYAGCNFLCADRASALVLHAGDRLRVQPLPPGLHVLTARDVNDDSDRRTAHALAWLGARDPRGVEGAVAALKELCGQAGNGTPPVCLRGERGGTVSSSILALRDPPGRGLYLHAQGPPDVTPYLDYSHLLQGWNGPPGA